MELTVSPSDQRLFVQCVPLQNQLRTIIVEKFVKLYLIEFKHILNVFFRIRTYPKCILSL